jgi:hypothetical protein
MCHTFSKFSAAFLFSTQPCWMIEPLATELHYSIPSVRRFLTETGYYSRFTHNGGWYTLRSIPRFGRDGLWFESDIGFSRAGSLTKTLIDLTTRSPAGLNADQLGERLRCRCHTVLVYLYRHGRLQREKLGRSYVYFAADPCTAASQRQALIRPHPPAAQLPAEIAVLLLADFSAVQYCSNSLSKQRSSSPALVAHIANAVPGRPFQGGLQPPAFECGFSRAKGGTSSAL